MVALIQRLVPNSSFILLKLGGETLVTIDTGISVSEIPLGHGNWSRQRMASSTIC
jgi:hypothetical protein